jgi:hypothetical protein
MFWHTEKHALPSQAVEWRRRFEAKVDTVVRMRGLPPIEARREAYRGLVVDYANETFPGDCDPNRCAHCRGIEAPPEVLIPLGVGPHAWLHRSCADSWRECRRESAIEALAAMKIEAP